MVSAPRFRLQAQLLVLLLAFGAIPVGLSMGLGYAASRATIIEQAERALRELGGRQASHIVTELRRQRLLLRTITVQLSNRTFQEAVTAERASDLLTGALLDDGVFDGLRLVDAAGNLSANVALRDMTPHWPTEAPAADWANTHVVIHRNENGVVAYLLAAPVTLNSRRLWLEGHVRAQDFARLFDIPTHMMEGVELGVFSRTADPILVPHSHFGEELASSLSAVDMDSLSVVRTSVDGVPALVLAAPVAEANWILVAALPLHVAMAPLASFRNRATLAAGVLVLLIFLIANLASRFVTTPLRELATAARDFGKTGKYDSIQHRGSAEVDALVESFDRMAQDWMRSREEIDRLHSLEMERAQQLATVGELASGVAHEIRNPLTGVLGAIELVQRRLTEDDPTLPLLEEAREQLRRMETTTTRLLQYARPPELVEMVVDTGMLVERAARIVEAPAQAAEIDLKLERSETPVPVRADPELMVQVLVNLMLNAIEAMSPADRLTVSVATHAREAEIRIRDTGPGIPPELQSEIFRPFFTTKPQGTGLGLSISQKIIQRHGGSLSADSTSCSGTTFFIVLPLVNEEGTSCA
jgi:signal transduction histidine kinase